MGPPCLCPSEREGPLPGEGSRAAGRAWELLSRTLERPASSSRLSAAVATVACGGQPWPTGPGLSCPQVRPPPASGAEAQAPRDQATWLASAPQGPLCCLPGQMNPVDQASRGGRPGTASWATSPPGVRTPSWSPAANLGPHSTPKQGGWAGVLAAYRGGNRHTGAVLARSSGSTAGQMGRSGPRMLTSAPALTPAVPWRPPAGEGLGGGVGAAAQLAPAHLQWPLALS